jgi:acyl-CoA thioester hydrolase
MMHEHQIRVRYAETDRMGVAHHAAYVPWLEEARIEAMKELGLNYRELEERGVMMPVIDLQVQYKRSLQFDDTVLFQTSIEVLGPSRLAFHSRILGEDEKLRAEATVVVASVTSEGRPCRIPEDLLAVLRSG